MLSEDEVIMEAFRLWRDNPSHMRNSGLYADEDVLRPMGAGDALLAFAAANPGLHTWETVDWPRLKSRFIDYIDYRLRLSGRTYDQVMQQRRVDLIAA